MNAATALLADAAPRAPRAAQGMYESYFLRANHPSRPLAVWTKATVLKSAQGESLQESWFAFFDGERQRTWASKRTERLSASFSTESADALVLSPCGATWTIAPQGQCKGSVDGASWDLSFERLPGAVGEPRSFYPRKLIEGGFPRAKGVTPLPAMTVQGEVEVFGEKVRLDGWRGALGHNWGREHPRRHAWAQCVFPESADNPASWVEAITGSVKLAGPLASPLLSTMIVQRGEESYRFDRIFDPWNQRAVIEDSHYTLELFSDDGRAVLDLDGAGRPRVCLGYRDPTGALGYCINTKLARISLRVEPRRGAPFTLHSEHGGALEFVQREPVRGLEVV